jgi:broad specificity phosphatase PhoE
MKIVIMRHGKPEMPVKGRLKASELGNWVQAYNAAGISRTEHPPAKAVEIAACCKAVVCSDLPRSLQSAEALKIRIDNSDALFREMDLPFPDWNWPRLPILMWAALLRMLWFSGYSSNCESFILSKQRAADATQKLVEMAFKSGSLLLVGHGFINHFIARQLLDNGRHGPSSPGKGHWQFGVYRVEPPPAGAGGSHEQRDLPELLTRDARSYRSRVSAFHPQLELGDAKARDCW